MTGLKIFHDVAGCPDCVHSGEAAVTDVKQPMELYELA